MLWLLAHSLGVGVVLGWLLVRQNNPAPLAGACMVGGVYAGPWGRMEGLFQPNTKGLGLWGRKKKKKQQSRASNTVLRRMRACFHVNLPIAPR